MCSRNLETIGLAVILVQIPNVRFVDTVKFFCRKVD